MTDAVEEWGVRRSARVILVDERGRALLLAARDFPRPGITLWMPPGGGVHDGESFEQAAAREVFEETGLRDAQIGPWIWFREHTFHWAGSAITAQERLFVARCSTFEPTRENLEQHEIQFISRYSWWTPEAIAASKDYFVPRALARLLPDIVAGRYPDEPIDCGV